MKRISALLTPLLARSIKKDSSLNHCDGMKETRLFLGAIFKLCLDPMTDASYATKNKELGGYFNVGSPAHGKLHGIIKETMRTQIVISFRGDEDFSNYITVQIFFLAKGERKTNCPMFYASFNAMNGVAEIGGSIWI